MPARAVGATPRATRPPDVGSAAGTPAPFLSSSELAPTPAGTRHRPANRRPHRTPADPTDPAGPHRPPDPPHRRGRDRHRPTATRAGRVHRADAGQNGSSNRTNELQRCPQDFTAPKHPAAEHRTPRPPRQLHKCAGRSASATATKSPPAAPTGRTDENAQDGPDRIAAAPEHRVPRTGAGRAAGTSIE